MVQVISKFLHISLKKIYQNPKSDWDVVGVPPVGDWDRSLEADQVPGSSIVEGELL
jgi:hypothetical protein